MRPLVYSLCMLCALGSTVFATSAAARKLTLGVLAFAFAAVTVLLGRDGVPDVAAVGAFAALSAGIELYRPGVHWITAFSSGALAAVLAALIRAQNVPMVPSLVVSLAVPAVAVYLAARGIDFAPRRLREEGFLMVLILGVLLAAAPGISAGWTSALALNIGSGSEGGSSVKQAIPAWVWLIGASSLALGGLYSTWRRS